MERMLTARQVADFLGVHPNWVYANAVRGALPSYKVGSARRFRASEVLAWLEEQVDTTASPIHQSRQARRRTPRERR